MTEDMSLYRINALTYRYNARFELSIPELTITKGASIGLVGPNGSGKSTLLRILAFLEPSYEGAVYFKGLKVENNGTGASREVTMLLQDPYLLKRSVFENVAYGLKVREEKDNLRERVSTALRQVGLSPDDFSERRWHELSGGEAQRVALASRLILEPEVLILDEPTASVDQQSASLIKEAITSLRMKRNMTLIIASHDMLWLNTTTDEILKMHEGRIVGHALENVIKGPWAPASDGLWTRTLPDGQTVCAATPPHESQASALLHPSDIMISLRMPEGISAQNILTGTITQMTRENESDKILVIVDLGSISLSCRVTHRAAETLHLLPGKNVLTLFKASSLHWQ